MAVMASMVPLGTGTSMVLPWAAAPAALFSCAQLNGVIAGCMRHIAMIKPMSPRARKDK
jgi:hypothetical protein